MNLQQANRLLNVANALRDAHALRLDFDMDRYGWSCAAGERNTCGTPACALGHYAARHDLQRLLTLDKDGDLTFRNDDYSYPDTVGHAHRGIQKHFGLEAFELCELFDHNGCDEARNPLQAATYIEKFVERKDFDVQWSA